MNTKHLFYTILLGTVFGITLGVLVYSVPAGAEKLARDLVELECHHDKEPKDCGCDKCADSSDCENCSECSSGDSTKEDASGEKTSKGTESSISCPDEAAACAIEG